ncbi:MAG: urea ABC transporter permease subunit UrtB [Geminicoccaceae bacterium]
MFIHLLAFILAFVATPLAAQEQDISAEVRALAEGGYGDRAEAVAALAATGVPAVAGILAEMRAGNLHVLATDGAADTRIVIARPDGDGFRIRDAVTGEDLGRVGKQDVEKIRVNNRLRRAIDDATSALTLKSPDPAVRMAAASNLFASAGPGEIPLLEDAIASENDPAIREAFVAARAAALLRDPDADEVARTDAVQIVAALGTLDANALLSGAASGEGPVAEAAAGAMAAIQRELALWDAGQNIVYGASLGSVLLLAAIGLAITFGVMGVINLAHGEMVMIGAYTTFVVQEFIRTSMPGLFDLSLFIAIPLAFLVAGLVGIAIERGIIRWLYGRPLETLLATWGISLILQQAVRSIFGPTNREVGNPSWMSGSIELGQMVLTWNRIWIFVFALIVFFGLLAILRKTRFGLYTRAVTQNREMASAMGIRTGRVDALTFGLGSGIAGLAGVALSQIDNVSPNLGQGYIIDSFLVVVFGGVGNLWGTLTGAMMLGVLNKFIEPQFGAVLGKILVLVLIILFIQKRPRGLFAQRGRAVEA